MLDFSIKVNNVTFMSSEIIPYITKCKSNEAIEYIIKKTSCTANEAEEVISDIKNMMYNKGYSMHTRKKLDTFNVCPNCGKKYSVIKTVCGECGYSTNKNINKDKKEILNQYTEDKINIPKCPTCGSTNIRKISGTKKAASIIGLGILSNNIGKTFECINCKYKW